MWVCMCVSACMYVCMHVYLILFQALHFSIVLEPHVLVSQKDLYWIVLLYFSQFLMYTSSESTEYDEIIFPICSTKFDGSQIPPYATPNLMKIVRPSDFIYTASTDNQNMQANTQICWVETTLKQIAFRTDFSCIFYSFRIYLVFDSF